MSSTAVSVLPGLAAQPGRRMHVGELRGGDRGGGEHVRAWTCTAAPARLPKNACTARSAQPLKSLPSTEWPVNGTTSSCASGIRAATCASVRRRRAQILRAGEDQRRHVRQRGRRGRRRGGVGPARAVGHQAVAERGARVERVEVARSAGARAGRRALPRAASPAGARAARGTASPRRWWSTNSASSIVLGLSSTRAADAARWGSAPLTAGAGAAADRGRGAAPTARRRAAARAAPGSGRRPRGCRAGRPRSA